MADQKEQVESTVTGVEAPADFLERLSQELREKEDVDVGLVDILAKHLLTAAPNVGAVAQAKEAIQKLAGERANLSKSEATGG